MRYLQNKIPGILQEERQRWILWIPVFYAIGIGMYFILPYEPLLKHLVSIVSIALSICFTIKFLQKNIWFGLLVLAIAAGGLTAGLRTKQMAAPVLAYPVDYAQIEGTVDEITVKEGNTKLLLSSVKIDRLAAEKTPIYITITLKQPLPLDAVKLNDRISLSGGLFPPPKASYPGSYAFNRHYYFKRIGATGFSFAKNPPTVLKRLEENSLFGRISRIRADLFSRLMEGMGDREGSVAGALTMGEQRAIPQEIFDSMRDSGLAHILSISGLHMTLAAGIFFVTVRFLLAALPWVALRFHTKKIAAIIALIGAFVYLLLSGWPIPAQRSYIMIALVLLAVIFDRQVTPIRSLALAAMLVLFFLPESLLNPSFQLSFAATTALVAYYEHRRDAVHHKNMQQPVKWYRTAWRYLLDIALTSMMATLATTPFILYHFQGFPIYSILGNLLTLWLVSFWIMPLILLLLLLFPFGLDGWVIPPLKLGIHLMIRIGEWVASLPHAVVNLPPLPVGGLIVCVLGGLWICLWQTRWRHYGWLAIIGSITSLWFYIPPDMIVSEDGKKIALRISGSQILMARGRPEGFQQKEWQRFAQVEKLIAFRKMEGNDNLHCDQFGCFYEGLGKKITIAEHREALWEDCGLADIVLVPEWSASEKSYTECKALLFDRRWFAHRGTTAFWFKDGIIRYRTVRSETGHRPWD